ncbi:tannase/feruloyl esterase family alpha/beta hydrolase [Pusillimonas noertemannii]|uniref:Feruloyl esterase n=1 Tax=Pusillimonas noertemannii TaxID=305977 RepID=A0A2U1CK61_9BURK|nr:tannase/feruloyl esterase family alpha/beta hydrolase [Pusillimonas noertemannii]PVY61383.1 feruloyl esterase [Pusillimonas noertemannii]
MKRHIALSALAISGTALLAACGSDSSPSKDPVPPPTLSCDDSIKEHFKPDELTTVVQVKSFKAGEPLTLGQADGRTPNAENDVCLVKLNVGPGNPGPEDAPSTSAGIGIEVWLPTKPEQWNGRLRAIGGGGWAGGPHGSTEAIGDASAGATAALAGEVTATTDTGHSILGSGSFAMLPDGTINTVLWKDFAERAIHQTAVKSKALAEAYYGKMPEYAYWTGASTGGRQGLKFAQVNPEDFDGILAGYPAINWSKFITTELYPQIVVQRDLGGNHLSNEQLDAASNAAIAACDLVGGEHLGYISDPASCTYDPTQDLDLLCTTDGGNNGGSACLTTAQALAVNKFWYGQTADGSVPAPDADNGMSDTLATNHKWYGLTRGSTLTALAGEQPFPIAVDQVTLELQDPTYASPSFKNATGDGQDKWKTLSYAQLADAWDRGVQLQSEFANINTDNPDLSVFRDAGGKMITYYGLADQLIPPQGTLHYYRRVTEQMGGLAATQEFYRLYFVPGMGHGLYNGTSNPLANPPLPTMDQLYKLLTDWVEQGTAPAERVDISTQATDMFPEIKSRPICLHPLKAKFVGGDPKIASSYECAAS